MLPSAAILLLLIGHAAVSAQNCSDSELPDVPHAEVQVKKDAYNPGETVTFPCETGYSSGRPIRYVCAGGRFEPMPPKTTCKLRPCVLPDDILNGYYQIIQGEDFVFGTTIKYFCNEGYQMISMEDTRTCLLGGWSNHLPVCEPLSCSAPPPVPGVTVEGLPMDDGPILPDRLLTFSCNAPHSSLNGSDILICGPDGKWDKPFPNCVGTCDVERVPNSVQVAPPNERQLLQGQSLRFRCKNRQQFIRGEEQVTCLENGQWSHTFPSCTDAYSCGPPPALEFGDYFTSTSQYKHGTKVEYQCRAKYVMAGRPHKTCKGGVWTGDITCLKPCTVNPDLMLPNKITFRYGTEYKLYAKHMEPIEFTCLPGATHDGNAALRQICLDGHMTLPKCVETEMTAENKK